MSKHEIKQFIAARTDTDGLTESGIEGLRLFRATQEVPCVPAVYEPCVVAIVSGSKEVVLEGHKYVYDDSQYLCCPMSMPVKAGTPGASPEEPLYGVLITLNQRAMAALSMEMDNAGSAMPSVNGGLVAQGIKLAAWDQAVKETGSKAAKSTIAEGCIRLIAHDIGEAQQVKIGVA